MTPKRARDVVKEINKNLQSAGELLLEFRDQEGWKALGYKSFKEACEKEFKEQYGSRAQVYRLMTQAEVSTNVSPNGDTHVPVGQAVHLGRLPADEQKDALDEAKEKSGGTPTTADVKAAVSRRQSPAEPAKKKSPPKKSNAKFEEALLRIGHICGKPVLKALEAHTLKLKEKEVIYWAKLDDAEMADIQELVVTKRWQPSKAYQFRNRMVGSKTTVEQLIFHCIAEGGKWEATITGFDFTVKEHRR